MTPTEKQEIIDAVINSLQTNSLDILDLTEVESLPSDAYIEVSGGRRILVSKLVEAGVKVLEERLDDIFDYQGVATPNTEPGTPDHNVCYLAGAGTYTNFGSTKEVPEGSVGIIKYDGEWKLETVAISAPNSVQFTEQTLTVEQQAQARANIGLGDEIDVRPIKGSNHLVTSGGVAAALDETIQETATQDLVNNNDFTLLNHEDIFTQQYVEAKKNISSGVDMYKGMKAMLDAAKPTGVRVAGGRCGDTLYWELLDNGLVHIYGSGRMYDYVKGTNIGLNKESIGYFYSNPFMFYYGFHITPLRMAMEDLKAEGYSDTSYKGVATSSTIPVVSGKAFYMVKPTDTQTTFTNFATSADTSAIIPAGNFCVILKRDTSDTYWTQVNVKLDIDDGIVYDERTIIFTGDGVATEFVYDDKLNVCNEVSVNGTLVDDWTYNSVSGVLSFSSAPSAGADIVCEFAQYVVPWYIYRREESYNRYVWKNGDSEVYTTMRTPTTSDKAFDNKTFSGQGLSISSASSSSINVGGVDYTYSTFVTGYCSRPHYLQFNPNEHIYDSISIDPGITYIGDWGMYRNSANVLIIPEGVLEVGIWCIRYSSYTRAVSFPSTLEKIGWYGCSRMEVLEYIEFLGNSLTYCDDCAFHNCVSLKGLILPASVSHIGNMLAYSNRKMQVIDIGSAEDVPNQSFQNANACKTLMLGNSVVSIGHSAFQYAGFERLVIPATLLSIGNAAFLDCTSLKEVVMNSSAIAAQIAGDVDFGYLMAYATICYLPKGMESAYLRSRFCDTGAYGKYNRLVKWGHVNIFDSVANGLLQGKTGQNAGCHYIIYKTDIADEFRLFMGGYDGTNTINTNTSADFISDYVTKVVELEVDDKVKSVNFDARYLTNLRKIIIGSEVIGDTFALNSTISELILLDGIKQIGTSSFAGCSNLAGNSIEIPDSVETVGNTCFDQIAAVFVLGKGLKNVGNRAFALATSVMIPSDNSIETIGTASFFSWSGEGMSELYLPKIKSIGQNAFVRFQGAAKGCADVYIGPDVTEIMDGAFAFVTGSTRVCNIHIAASQNDVTVGSTAFGAGCTVTWDDNWMNL